VIREYDIKQLFVTGICFGFGIGFTFVYAENMVPTIPGAAAATIGVLGFLYAGVAVIYDIEEGDLGKSTTVWTTSSNPLIRSLT